MANWKAPFADSYPIYDEIGDQIHTIVCGSSGCGKSVVIEGVMYNLVNRYTPDELEIYLIDPKMTDLFDFSVLPHVRGYSDNDDDAMMILDALRITMDRRNKWCQENHCKVYPGSMIYCFVEEAGDLVTRRGREAITKIQILVQKARTANIHLVFCAQTVNRKLFPTEVQANLTCKVALKVRKDDKTLSRLLVGSDACMKLPKHGKCILITPDSDYDDDDVRDVPMYEDIRFEFMFDYWRRQSAAGRSARV